MTVAALKELRDNLPAEEPHCPYCLSTIDSWPIGKSLCFCSECRRPLWLFPKANSKGYRQILSVIDAGRTYIALAAILFFFSLFLFGNFTGAVAFFSVLVLVPFGIFDLIDAYAGARSRIQRLPGFLFEGSRTVSISIFKTVWGTATLVLAAAILFMA